MKGELNEAGRQQVAAALVLLRQWKDKDTSGFEPKTVLAILRLAQALGVEKEYGKILVAMPRYRFVDKD
ncbi:hypothetical protein LCGC14_2747410 [marine sediment metagenome]|uniref:Uncharacterized protein n=1 Tax=marine sediment metagenome TaxID=412755 RepID=A0A0F9BBJ9_9ZZZZ